MEGEGTEAEVVVVEVGGEAEVVVVEVVKTTGGKMAISHLEGEEVEIGGHMEMEVFLQTMHLGVSKH